MFLGSLIVACLRRSFAEVGKPAMDGPAYSEALTGRIMGKDPNFARNDPTRRSQISRLAWLPIPVLFAAMVGLWAADLRGSHESVFLGIALNLVFSTLVSLLVAYLIARSFLVRGTLGLLLLGCGVVLWGLAGVVATAAAGNDVNVLIAIHNSCVWLSALCHLAGVFLSLRPKRTLFPTALWLPAAYMLAATAVALVTLSARVGWMPTFFIQSQGGTLLRQFVLSSAIAMFGLTALLLLATSRRPLSPFAYWYALALALIVAGLFGVMLESSAASVLGWTGRGTQFLSGLYMLIAAVASVRESHLWGISLEAALRRERDFSAAVLDTAGALVVVLDAQGRITRFNRACERLTGYPAARVLGRVFWEFLIPPDDMAGVMDAWGTLNAGSYPNRYENHWLTRDGTQRLIEWSNTTLTSEAGEVRHIIAIGIDITQRKRAERQLEANLVALTRMHNLSTKLMGASGLKPLLQEIMDAAVAIGGAERGTLQMVEGDTLSIVAHHGHHRPFLDFFASAEKRASVCGEAMKSGQRAVVEDVECSPLFAGTPSLKVLREAGVRAVQSTPLRDRQGALLGILTTQWSTPHVPDEHDLWRIDLLARQAADLIEHKRAEETLRNANEDLRAQAEQLQTANELLESKQCELEGANEQLREQEQDLAQHAKALRESEERYRTLVETAPDGLVVHRDGRLLYANGVALSLVGAESFEQLASHAVLDFFRPEEREQAAERICAAMAGNKLPVREATLLRLDSQEVPVEFHSAPIDFQGVRAVQTIIRDITDHKRTEESLHESEALMHAVMDGSPDLIYVKDTDGRVVLANPAACQALGRSAEEVIGKTTREFHSDEPDGGRAIMENDWRIMRSGRTEIIEELGLKGCTYLSTKAPYRDAAGNVIGLIGISHDITERRRAEETLRELNATLESRVAERTAELEKRAKQLQRLTLELSQAEDRERKRIAAILHEDLQQHIAAAKFHLGLLSNRLKHNPPERAIADRVDELLKEAIQKSRGLSHDLCPAVLNMNDIAEVLQWLAGRMQTNHGLAVRVDVRGERKLQSEALTMFLFRAAQEMLSNVVRHAEVHEAAIRVRRIGRYVSLSVSDRGCGFDPQELRETSGFGLLGIRERVELLGGRMKIRSIKGKGSRFHIVVPDGELSTKAVTSKEPITTVSGQH